MRIHQYYYLLSNGTAKATPVYGEHRGEKKLSFAGSRTFACASSADLEKKVLQIVGRLPETTPLTTVAHLSVAHVSSTTHMPATAEAWFAVAEACVRQEKEGLRSENELAVWRQWLVDTWPKITVPAVLSSFTANVASGADLLDMLRAPEETLLSTICLLAANPETPVTAAGASADTPPLRLSINWSEKTKSMSFRGVYALTEHSRMDRSILETVFMSETASVFQLKNAWTSRSDAQRLSRENMQERELLQLRHLTVVDDSVLDNVLTFLQNRGGFTREELLVNEYGNISKKNNILTKRVFERILGAPWENIRPLQELLHMSGDQSPAVVAALLQGFTEHVTPVNPDTGLAETAQLPDLNF